MSHHTNQWWWRSCGIVRDQCVWLVQTRGSGCEQIGDPQREFSMIGGGGLKYLLYVVDFMKILCIYVLLYLGRCGFLLAQRFHPLKLPPPPCPDTTLPETKCDRWVHWDHYPLYSWHGIYLAVTLERKNGTGFFMTFHNLERILAQHVQQWDPLSPIILKLATLG